MHDFAKGLCVTQLIPQKRLTKLIKKWEMDKGVTKLSTRKLLDILIRSSIFQKLTLRDITDSYGIPKSTLDDALRKRSSGFFEELFSMLIKELLPLINQRRQRQEMRELIAIDSSVCLVHGSMAERFISTKIEKKVAGIKFHAAWNSTHEWIEEFTITGYRKNDGAIGKTFSYSRGKTYVFDRAYVDINLWMRIQESGAHFVTRLKKNGDRLKLIHDYNNIDSAAVGILYDGPWGPSERTCRRVGLKPKTVLYRHIIYRDPVSKKLFDFITSDFDCKAIEVANTYRKRWSVELLFRWLKSHLNIRRLSFKNINAIKVQISIAVLVQILIRYKMLKEEFTGTSWDYLRSLRNSLDRIFYQTACLQGIDDLNVLKSLPVGSFKE